MRPGDLAIFNEVGACAWAKVCKGQKVAKDQAEELERLQKAGVLAGSGHV